jgi:hypothetical protein
MGIPIDDVRTADIVYQNPDRRGLTPTSPRINPLTTRPAAPLHSMRNSAGFLLRWSTEQRPIWESTYPLFKFES